MLNPQDQAKYRQLYLHTAQQYLQIFTTNINQYKNGENIQTAIEQMFIAIHSIKSQSQVMGYTKLGDFCKQVEPLLRNAKDTHTSLAAEQIEFLQSVQSFITVELQSIQETGSDTEQNIDSPQQTAASGPAKRILLVDDDTFFEQFYSYKLQESGFHIDLAKNGEEALQKLSTHPNVVLLDLVMPDKDGFEVLSEKNQNADPMIKNIPVIVFSTLGQEKDIQRAKSLGAVDYINKSSFDFASLLGKIREYIK